MVQALDKKYMIKRSGPLVLVVMDGVGYGDGGTGDAVKAAHTETLDWLEQHAYKAKLKAHGEAVGLPSDDDIGNSEVGHNAMGAGRIFAQGARLVNESIDNGRLFAGDTWQALTAQVKTNGSTLHFIGLLSDGNVHSHINHLKRMVEQAKAEGVQKVRIHALLDGRDVSETSALMYIEPFEEFLAELNDEQFDARIASGGGRMQITMDRYGSDWPMVERGWQTHVLGQGRQFVSAVEAVATLREETNAIDQNLLPFVIAEDGVPVGTIEDGDSVIIFNFRGDRMLELTKAFEEAEFHEFDRVRRPDVAFAAMLEYDGEAHIPRQFLVSPPQIDRTLPEYLAASGVRQFSISEEQKFGHVTYFFNGNRSKKFSEELETYEKIPSFAQPFTYRPWMRCAEITDRVIEVMDSGEYKFIRLNYPNGDMIGHTGDFEATVCSLEAMDIQLSRLVEATKKLGGILMVTADHGNAEDMLEKKSGEIVKNADGSNKAKTAHTTNPVPLYIYDPSFAGEYDEQLREGLGLATIAPTVMNLLGYEAPADYVPSAITPR